MTKHTVELDVRPYLKKKLEPFEIIMDTVKTLGEQDTLVLHTTFKPAPLFMLMKAKGFAHETEKRDSEHWVTTFWNKHAGKAAETQTAQEKAMGGTEEQTASAAASEQASASDRPRIHLDNRGLQPPEPMIRTLNALEKCSPGDEVLIHNDRVPMFLVEELKNLGYQFSVQEQPDGSAKVTIRKS